jgi:hypothetical protein
MTVVRLLQSDCGPPLYSSADLVSALLAAASQPPRISSTGTTLPTLRAQGPARDLRPATTATGGTGREPRTTLRCRQRRAKRRPCRRRTTTTTCPSGAAITERCVLLGWPLATGRRCLLLTSGTLSLFLSRSGATRRRARARRAATRRRAAAASLATQTASTTSSSARLGALHSKTVGRLRYPSSGCTRLHACRPSLGAAAFPHLSSSSRHSLVLIGPL